MAARYAGPGDEWRGHESWLDSHQQAGFGYNFSLLADGGRLRYILGRVQTICRRAHRWLQPICRLARQCCTLASRVVAQTISSISQRLRWKWKYSERRAALSDKYTDVLEIIRGLEPSDGDTSSDYGDDEAPPRLEYAHADLNLSGTNAIAGGSGAVESPSCCICFEDIAHQSPSLLLPCTHNGVVHNSCSWEWVCSRADSDSGVYHITCPVCRQSKTTRLASHCDVYGAGPLRRRPSIR